MEPQRSSSRLTFWRKSVRIPPLPSWWTASDRSFTTREMSLNWKGWFWEILTVQIHLGRWNIEEVLMELATPSTTHTPPAPILKKMAALSSSVRSWVTTSTFTTPSFSTPPQTPQHFLAFPSVSMEEGRWWRSFTFRLFQFHHSIVIDSSKVKKYVKLKPCQDDFYSCFEVEQYNRMFSYFFFNIFAGLHLQRDWLQTVWLTCVIWDTSQWGKCICKWANGSKLLYFKLCLQTLFLVIKFQFISSNGPMAESYFKLFPQTWSLSQGKDPRVVPKCSSAEQIFTMDKVITELVLATQKQVFENEQCF